MYKAFAMPDSILHIGVACTLPSLLSIIFNYTSLSTGSEIASIGVSLAIISIIIKWIYADNEKLLKLLGWPSNMLFVIGNIIVSNHILAILLLLPEIFGMILHLHLYREKNYIDCNKSRHITLWIFGLFVNLVLLELIRLFRIGITS